ncbi:AAA family ATPase [Iamia sp. SCSIO 61187]|uniref:AAA family ATPase n=1 Tax=Iamia sp. SCSIO 61187 TaxID=2722752 RepID=UPI001C630CEB|nr:AAA family ATPase [Iamia sp. SCSIO 61187]QYG93459.1 AAA family ATPase [Iamia sp. SCSIO 61187]
MSDYGYLHGLALEHGFTTVDQFPDGTPDALAKQILLRLGEDPPPETNWILSPSAVTVEEEPCRLTLVPASSVTIRRPTFLWTGRIPESAVTLFAGREGLGKTVLATHLAARVTQGELPGSRMGRPGDVVYIGTEDDRETVLVPRLLAADADLSRVHFVDVRLDAFSVARDVADLDVALSKLDPALTIIDPVDAHLGGGVDSHKKAEVQAALGALALLAQRHRCSIVAVAHLNKGESRDVLTKVVGSVGFTTSVRSVLAVGEHPDEPRDRVCVLRKANMTDASAVPAFRYRIESAMVQSPDGPIDTAGVVALGEELGLDPNAILSVPDLEERTARTEAAEWLREVLEDGGGSLPSKEIKRLAEEADISGRTLQRARREVGIEVTRHEHKPGRPSTWTLPSVPTGSGQLPCGTHGTNPDTGPDLTLPAKDPSTCQGSDTGAGTILDALPGARAVG